MLRTHIWFLSLALASIAVACSGTQPDKTTPVDPGLTEDTGAADTAEDVGDSTGLNPDGDVSAPCTNLKCQRVHCPDGKVTTLTGIVKDPGGNVPLYNVVAYIPNTDLTAFPPGVTCDKCGALVSGSPISTGLTNAKGQFVLNDVPVGVDIPLVVQVGKWRKKVTIPKIDACVGNNAGVIKLPKNHKEGDIPKIAIATGGADSIECVFKKMGIDEAEFTNGTGKGHIHIYTGNGGGAAAGSTSASDFWKDLKQLKKYDMVILSCEGSEYPDTKPSTATDAMHDYANAGGKVFGSHYHYYWFKNGPADFQGAATWTGGSFSADGEYDIDTTFPKGKSFAEWLFNVKASSVKGKISLKELRDDVSGVPKTTQRWVYKDTVPKYLSFATPVKKKPEDQCGRAVFTDIHVGSGNTPGRPFPTGCTPTLSPQEMALEFLLFDLASCVQGDDKEPVPPPPQ